MAALSTTRLMALHRKPPAKGSKNARCRGGVPWGSRSGIAGLQTRLTKRDHTGLASTRENFLYSVKAARSARRKPGLRAALGRRPPPSSLFSRWA
jgi:hypothetical protein